MGIMTTLKKPTLESPAGGGQVGGGPTDDAVWGRMLSTWFPPPTSPPLGGGE